MKKHYRTNWLSSCYRSAVMLSAALLIVGVANAQLSGNYTINSGASTGGSNFKSFADLTSALSSDGVKGAVLVDVVSGSGPYAEKVTLPEVKNASASYTITIRGNGETVVNTASSAAITFDGADYYRISNLKIDAQGTGTGTRCIHLWKDANYNSVENCELIVSKYTGTSNSTGYIVMSNSTTGNSAALHGSHNTFSGNKMWNGGASSSVGPYYACADYRSSSYASTTGNNVYSNNDISNVYYYWFYMYYTNGFKVENNKIHNNRSGATYAYVLYAYYCQTTTHNMSYSKNDIYSMNPTNYLYHYTYRTSGTASMPFEINDNKFRNNSCYYMYNYLGYYGDYVHLERNDVDNNSVEYYLYNMMGYYSSNSRMVDNKIHHNTAGYYVYGMYPYYASNALVEGNAVHDNTAGYGVQGFYCYYMTGKLINNMYYNNTGDYYNYGIYGGYTTGSLDICHNTIIMDDDVDYYNYVMYLYMYNTFSSINVKNNIIDVSGRAGYYNYIVYAPYNYDKMNFENNDFYVTSPSTNYWYTNGQNTTLAAFNSSVQTNSNINVDPKYADRSKGDFTPSNPVIANYGQPGYATLDFNDKTRTACGPDIGALEFTIDHSASNLVFTGTKECGGYMEAIKFTFNNGANIDLEDARVYYTINKGTAAEIHVE